MKKLLLGLGSLAAVIAPVAAVVACGADSTAPAKGANENGAGIVQRRITSLDQLNDAIANAIEQDVQNSMDDQSIIQVPRTFYEGKEKEVTLKDANAWDQSLTVVKDGFVKVNKGKYQKHYSATPKAGFVKSDGPLILWRGATDPGAVAAWDYTDAGIENLFADVMHGGWSLSRPNLKDGGENTGFQATYKVITSIKNIDELN